MTALLNVRVGVLCCVRTVYAIHRRPQHLEYAVLICICLFSARCNSYVRFFDICRSSAIFYTFSEDFDRHSEVGTCRPLDIERVNALRYNRPTLSTMIDSDVVFLDHLEARKCITARQKSALGSRQVAEDRNSLLVDILVRRSIADFDNFIASLEETGQQHLVPAIACRGGNSWAREVTVFI